MQAASLWNDLYGHAKRLESTTIKQLNAASPQRARRMSHRVGELYFNFARQHYDENTLDTLFALADNYVVRSRIQALFDGETINATEQRSALHTALRSDLSSTDIAKNAHAEAAAARTKMAELVDALTQSNVTDIVSIGIGGSDLGPRLVSDALKKQNGRFRVHYLSNVDSAAAYATFAQLDPAKTAVILISKTFTTQETLLNGEYARQWLQQHEADLVRERMYAVSSNLQRVAEFGIDEAHVLPMWDWVGGRYSLWSAVGFPIALSIGMKGFEELLEGAAAMDQHVLQAELRENVATWHALTAIWNRNGLHHATHAVLPYSEQLRLLPNYLQQLVMESLGKRVQIDGAHVEHATVPVWWGGPGTDTQHSFFQALHQGTQIVPADFIGIIKNQSGPEQNHRALLANLLAQTQALADGQESDNPHRVYPGNRPNTLILLNALTPHTLGSLIAMYEHSVFIQSVIWQINAFDQYGVELGKQLANTMLPALETRTQAGDAVTQEVMNQMYQIT